jgi:hypothetical protein
MLHALFIFGAAVPVAAMLGSLSAAAWIHEGRRREAPARRR